MSFEYKKSYIVAGLVASLTLGASLAVAPTYAHAEELLAEANVASVEQAAEVGSAPVAAEVEAPVAETTVAEAPVETVVETVTAETAAEEAPAESVASAAETPSEAAPTEDAAEDAGSQETPAESEASAKDTAVDNVSADETPAEDAAAEDAAAKKTTPSAAADAANTSELTFKEGTNAADESLELSGVAYYNGGHAENGSYQKNGWQKILNRYFWHNGSGKLQTGWVVTTKNYSNNKTGDAQRYWVDGTTGLVFNQVVNAGNNYYAYATDKGYVARNTSMQLNNIGTVLINNDGRFINNTGWLVSKSYGSGQQRYYLESTGKGYSVAKTGFFKAKLTNTFKEQTFYGNSKGYVSWGKLKLANGVLVANNDGALLENFYTNTGWLVTKDFDSDIQRYYLIKGSDGHIYAKVGEFKVGNNNYYGRDDQGYVVRGYYKNPSGKKYYADDNGVRTTKMGWYQGDDGWYFLYSHGDSARYGSAVKRAFDLIKNIGSSKPYFICIDKSNFRTMVFQRNNNMWCPIYEWECSHGRASNETASGLMSIVSKGYMMGRANWEHEFYWTQFNIINAATGAGQRIHSEIYWGYDNYLQDGRMGIRTSSGCVRLHLNNAKWIYDNCAIGTRVYIYW